MLRCSDGTYYVGSTTDLERRLYEHEIGMGAEYTRGRRPVVLVWQEWFDRIDEAFAREKQVQNWSRSKREALIAGDYAALPGLAESKHHVLRRRWDPEHRGRVPRDGS